jgi:hypothetical protein
MDALMRSRQVKKVLIAGDDDVAERHGGGPTAPQEQSRKSPVKLEDAIDPMCFA